MVSRIELRACFRYHSYRHPLSGLHRFGKVSKAIKTSFHFTNRRCEGKGKRETLKDAFRRAGVPRIGSLLLVCINWNAGPNPRDITSTTVTPREHWPKQATLQLHSLQPQRAAVFILPVHWAMVACASAHAYSKTLEIKQPLYDAPTECVAAEKQTTKFVQSFQLSVTVRVKNKFHVINNRRYFIRHELFGRWWKCRIGTTLISWLIWPVNMPLAIVGTPPEKYGSTVRRRTVSQ